MQSKGCLCYIFLILIDLFFRTLIKTIDEQNPNIFCSNGRFKKGRIKEISGKYFFQAFF